MVARRAARKQMRKAGKKAALPENASARSEEMVRADLPTAAADRTKEQPPQKPAKKDERLRRGEPSVRRDRRRQAVKPLTIAVVASKPKWKQRFVTALRKEVDASIAEAEEEQPGVVLIFGMPDGEQVTVSGRNTTVLIGELPDNSAETRALAEIAKKAGARFLPLEPLVRRYGRDAMLGERGVLSPAGMAILARAVDKVIRRTQSGRVPPPAADYAETVALAEDPTQLLTALDWTGTAAPRSWQASSGRQAIEDFLDGKMRPSKKEPPVTFADLLFGQRNLPDETEHALYSLDFVSQVLTYWLAKANRGSSSELAAIDNVVKARGTTASTLLAAAGETLGALAAQSKDLRDPAWRSPTMQRRAVAFELFLLCCRMAALRNIRFEPAQCQAVFRGLLDLLERLRPVAMPVGSATAVGELSIVACLALPLRKTPYGAALLEEAMEWLSRWQFEAGMSDGGVWLEGFEQQRTVLTTLSTLTADLRDADVPLEPIAAAATKLARFTDSFLGEGGAYPLIDELPADAEPKLKKTARAIIDKFAPRVSPAERPDGFRDATVFSGAGYFISRSATGDDPCSHLVLHARPAAQGGPSLSFSLGGKPLLIGGGTVAPRASRHIRQASRLQPATHNTIRINGQTYAASANRDPAAIRIENAWEQPDWAAMRMLDDTFDPVRLARTVIHLKPGHTLIVVDELAARVADAQFEQFWHLAPSLKERARVGNSVAFACADGGILSTAFDVDAAPVLSKGGEGAIGWTSPDARAVTPNPFIRRERHTASGLMASFFQWRPRSRRFEIAAEGGWENWTVVITTSGAALRFGYGDGLLRLVE